MALRGDFEDPKVIEVGALKQNEKNGRGDSQDVLVISGFDVLRRAESLSHPVAVCYPLLIATNSALRLRRRYCPLLVWTGTRQT
jgi:hypothetical protein